MPTAWSEPMVAVDGDADAVPPRHIVYRARLLDGDGEPMEIPRFWGADKTGTLLIGESKVGRTRFRELGAALCGKHVGRGHSAGYAFHYWFRWGHSKAENVVFEFFDLADNLKALGDIADADTRVSLAAELLLMERYRNANGDLPPCNTQGPKWRAVTEWMKEAWGIKWGYLPEAKSRLNVPIIEVPGIEAITVDVAKEVGEQAAQDRASRQES